MSLADLADVMNKKITIPKMKDKNGDDIVVTIKPITLNKARKIIENYGIFVEELILKKIDIEKIDDTDYARNFGMEKLDEAISYIIAVSLDNEEFVNVIQLEFPWYIKLEILNEIIQLSLPDDKKKAQETMQKTMELILEPILKILNLEKQ